MKRFRAVLSVLLAAVMVAGMIPSAAISATAAAVDMTAAAEPTAEAVTSDAQTAGGAAAQGDKSDIADAGARPELAEDGASYLYSVSVGGLTHPTDGWTYTDPTVSSSAGYTVNAAHSFMRDYGYNGDPDSEDYEKISVNITNYKFITYHVYKYILYFYPKDGYKFGSSVSVTSSTCSPVKAVAQTMSSGSTLRVDLTFAPVAPCKYNPRVKVTAPKLGEYPKFTVSPADADNDVFTVDTVKWRKDGKDVSSSQAFEEGTYSIYLQLRTKPGYRWYNVFENTGATALTAYVNGSSVKGYSYQKGAYCTLEYVFPKLEKQAVSSFTVNYTGPILGQSPGTTPAATIVTNEFSIAGTRWLYRKSYNHYSNVKLTRVMSSSEIFKNAVSDPEYPSLKCAYYLELRLRAKAGYKFMPKNGSYSGLVSTAGAGGKICVTKYNDIPPSEIGSYASDSSGTYLPNGSSYVCLDTNGDLVVALTFLGADPPLIKRAVMSMSLPTVGATPASLNAKCTTEGVSLKVDWTQCALDSAGNPTGSYVNMNSSTFRTGYRYVSKFTLTLPAGGYAEFAPNSTFDIMFNGVRYDKNYYTRVDNKTITLTTHTDLNSTIINKLHFDMKNLYANQMTSAAKPSITWYNDSSHSNDQNNDVTNAFTVKSWSLHNDTLNRDIPISNTNHISYGYVYTVSITLEIKEKNYSFNTSGVNTIFYRYAGDYREFYNNMPLNSKSASFKPSGDNQITVSYTYEAVPKIIEDVDLKLAETPRVGGTARIPLQYVYSGHSNMYTFENASGIDGCIYEKSTGKALAYNAVFEKGKTYQVRFYVTPVNGYGFYYYSDTTRTRIYVDNVEIDRDKGYLNGSRYVYIYEFVPETLTLERVDVTAGVPVGGDKLNALTVSSNESSKYTASVWHVTSSGSIMKDGDTFEADRDYTAYIEITPAGNYTVDRTSTKPYVNGTACTFSSSGRLCILFKFTVRGSSGSVLVGDVNLDDSVTNKDALILDRKLAKWKGYDDKITVKTVADLNRDTNITNKDSLILNRYLAKWKGYEKYIIRVNI